MVLSFTAFEFSKTHYTTFLTFMQIIIIFLNEVLANRELREPSQTQFFLFSSQITFVWTLAAPQPIRQRVVRWGRCLSPSLPECCCPFSPAIAILFEATDCCCLAQGSCGSGHSGLCPSAHFTAHGPWHCWLDACVNCDWTPPFYKSNPANIFDWAATTKEEPAMSP